MRFLIVLILLGCTPKAPEPQKDSISIQVVCPKEGTILSTPETVQCECVRPTASPSGGLLNVLAGAVGFFVKTLFE